jgi:hypothetical protein
LESADHLDRRRRGEVSAGGLADVSPKPPFFLSTSKLSAFSFDAPIEIFSGLDTDMAPADFLHGVSPDCLAGNPTINFLKTYETPVSTRSIPTTISTRKPCPGL